MKLKLLTLLLITAISINICYSSEEETYYNTASKYVSQGKYNEAINNFNQVLKINPQNAQAYFNIGTIKAVGFRDCQNAIGYFSKAIEYNPKYSDAYYQRAVCKAQIHDYQGSSNDYLSHIKLNGSYKDNAYSGIAKNYNSLNNYNEAIKYANLAIKENPKHSRAYNNRAVSKSMLNDYKGAIEDFTKVIELEPNVAGYYFNRAQCKANIGDKAGAQQDINTARKLMSK